MDFRKFNKQLGRWVVICFTVISFAGCSPAKKSNLDNTFYIELINFKNNSLRLNLANHIFGKGSYYKDNQLEIISLNYVTDNLPEMHYFKNAESLPKDIEADTRKIRIEFKDSFSLDSIKYSLQKFKYNNNEWVKISDLGVLREIKKFERPQNIIDEFVRDILLNVIEYSYN